ncbi:hypothetical protein CEXT_400951 [Caerostris extrusa]|uniref:Uncharacterized protein n=1 Tax=Caerostris extrusa TaxID=172846 RepID=A0AAV4WDM9_CAEEX|nr:hypothetical protein CEXT_400951 [Caerostris extrusa]
MKGPRNLQWKSLHPIKAEERYQKHRRRFSVVKQGLTDLLDTVCISHPRRSNLAGTGRGTAVRCFCRGRMRRMWSGTSFLGFRILQLILAAGWTLVILEGQRVSVFGDYGIAD